MRASKTPWWRAAPWHVSLHPWDRRKKKLRKRPARRGAGCAGTTAPDPPPPPPPAERGTRRLSFNEEVLRTLPLARGRMQPTVGTCSAGCDVPCSAGCDPCNPHARRCSWPSTSRVAAASLPRVPPCRSLRWSSAHGPGLRRRLRRSGSSRPCSHRSPRASHSRRDLLTYLLTYCRCTCYGHAYDGCAHRVRGAAGGTHTKPPRMRLQPV